MTEEIAPFPLDPVRGHVLLERVVFSSESGCGLTQSRSESYEPCSM